MLGRQRESPTLPVALVADRSEVAVSFSRLGQFENCADNYASGWRKARAHSDRSRPYSLRSFRHLLRTSPRSLIKQQQNDNKLCRQERKQIQQYCRSPLPRHRSAPLVYGPYPETCHYYCGTHISNAECKPEIRHISLLIRASDRKSTRLN